LKSAIACEICVEAVDIQALAELHGENDVRHNVLHNGASDYERYGWDMALEHSNDL
jgi:hypothetical protein